MSMIADFIRISPAQLDEYRNNPGLLTQKETEPLGGLSIEKTWDAIHYLLTGGPRWPEHPNPLAAAITGGEEFGDDIGYGPARFLTPKEVKDVANALSRVEAQDLKKRYNPDKMNELKIYPASWGESEDDLKFIFEHYHKLVAYYQAAADNGEAMLLLIV